MKYTVIFAVILGLYWIWRFVSSVMERGLPTHPVYYISAVVGAIIPYLFFKLMKKKVTGRRYNLIPLFILVIAIAFSFSGVEILEYIGTGLFYWYILVGLGFFVYFYLGKWRPKNELTDAEKMVESLNKILVFILPLMIILVEIL